MKTIAITLLTLALLAIGVNTATAAPTTPCEYEDSNYCVWDAKHMGNGEGKSFISTRTGKIKFITHRRAHRLLYTPRLHQAPVKVITFNSDPCIVP